MSFRVGFCLFWLRYRVVVTELHEHEQQVVMDATGDAYVADVATLTRARITADVDHDGPELLRKRLVAYLTNAAIQP